MEHHEVAAMYVPVLNRESDIARIRKIVRDYPFATLLTATDATLHTTHLPVVLHESEGEHGTLYFHLARANRHARALPGVSSVVIFHGPHAYVSPDWYVTSRTVPTWNYAVVHLHGVATPISADPEKLEHLAELVAEHEAVDGWSFAENSGVVGNELRGILAFRLPVEQVEAKFKLSQNLPAEDRQAVIHHLATAPDQSGREVAELMQTLKH